MKPRTIGAEWSRTISEGDYNSTKVTASIYYTCDDDEDPDGMLELAVIQCRNTVENNVPKKHRRLNSSDNLPEPAVKVQQYLAGIEIITGD